MFDLTLFAGAVVLQLSSAGLPIPGAKPILVGAGPLDGSNWSGPAVFPPAPWIMHPRTFRAPLRPRLTLSAPVLCARGWRASRHNADEPYGAYLQSQGNPEVCVCACVHVCMCVCARVRVCAWMGCLILLRTCTEPPGQRSGTHNLGAHGLEFMAQLQRARLWSVLKGSNGLNRCAKTRARCLECLSCLSRLVCAS